MARPKNLRVAFTVPPQLQSRLAPWTQQGLIPAQALRKVVELHPVENAVQEPMHPVETVRLLEAQVQVMSKTQRPAFGITGASATTRGGAAQVMTYAFAPHRDGASTMRLTALRLQDLWWCKNARGERFAPPTTLLARCGEGVLGLDGEVLTLQYQSGSGGVALRALGLSAALNLLGNGVEAGFIRHALVWFSGGALDAVRHQRSDGSYVSLLRSQVHTGFRSVHRFGGVALPVAVGGEASVFSGAARLADRGLNAGFHVEYNFWTGDFDHPPWGRMALRLEAAYTHQTRPKRATLQTPWPLVAGDGQRDFGALFSVTYAHGSWTL